MGTEEGLRSYFFIYLLAHTSFYMSQWAEHFSGVLDTAIWGVFGVTEIQWFQCVTMLVNTLGEGILSDKKIQEIYPEINDIAPVIADKTLMHVAALGAGILGVLSSLSSMYNVFEKVGHLRFFTEALASLVPLV